MDPVAPAPQQHVPLPVDVLVDAVLSCAAGMATVQEGSVGLSSVVRQWFNAQRRGAVPEDLLLGPRALRTWTRAVASEAQCLRSLDECGLLAAATAADAVRRLYDARHQVITLRSLQVSRDLLLPDQARQFTSAWDKVEGVLAEHQAAAKALPTERFEASARTLNLGREVHALRDTSGAWPWEQGFWPWDEKISDAALHRVRPHFQASWRQRAHQELANDLERLQRAVEAEDQLSLVERQVQPVLGEHYSRSSADTGRISTALRLLQEHLSAGACSQADLDAVWALPPEEALDTSTWQILTDLSAAREARSRTHVERTARGLQSFPATCLLGLDDSALNRWRRDVGGTAPLLTALLRSEQLRSEGQRLAGAAAEGYEARAERILHALDAARASAVLSDELSLVLEGAVVSSRAAYDVLDEELRSLLASLQPLGRASESWQDNVDRILRTVDARRAYLDAFRVVLFGRTGAGKSSFVEALSGGAGLTVSTGESDFTTVAQESSWGPCQLVDTPGIEGWGRETPTEVLEREARQAVDSADLVIMMFDTQNQKVSEFDRVARWVLDYDKPLLPLLNVRNSLWRRPDKEPDPEARRAVQASVAEHAQHIQDGLSAQGLHDQHPIAINMFSAVAARCPDYAGPYAPMVRAFQEQHAPEQLADFSNFPLLVDLLTDVLVRGAVDLRLQSLSNDLRQRVAHLAEQLRLDVEAGAGQVCTVEAAISRTLDVIGAGAVSSEADLDRQWRRGSVMPLMTGSDELSELERLRDERFTAPSLYGKLWDAFDDHWSVQVSTTVAAQSAAVEDAIRDAFSAGRDLSQAAVTALYQQVGQALQESAQAALSAVRTDLDEALRVLALTLDAAKVQHAYVSGGGVDVGRGSGQRNLGRALNAASMALVFVPVPGANILVAAGVRMVGQLLMSAFSKGRREAGERARAAELAQALRSARDAVLDLEHDIALQARHEVRRWTSEIATALRPEVQRALSRRRAAVDASAAADGLLRFLDVLPQQGAGTQAVRAARDHVVEARQGDAGWTALARGEDWLALSCAPAEGDLRTQARSQPDPPPAALTEPYRELTDFLLRLPEPDVEATAAWASLLPGLGVPVRGGEAGAGSRARLVGPARVGVSAVRHAVVQHLTDENGPALAERDAAPAGEDVVLLVVPPSLFGSPDELRSFEGARVTRQDTLRRLVVVLTRIDELVGDPDESPELLAAAVDRKLAEVRMLLARSGWPSDSPVVPMAGAPYAQREPRRWPWWSNGSRVAGALAGGLHGNGGAAGRVRGAIQDLEGKLELLGRSVDDDLLPQREALERAQSALVHALRRGERLRVSLPAQLTRHLEQVVLPLAYDLAGAANKTEVAKAQEALTEWRRLTAVDAIFLRFERDAVPEALDWLRAVGRELEHSVGHRDRSTRQGRRMLSDYENVVKGLRTVAGSASRLAGQMGQHRQYYQLGKDLGHNFRPWEAVKGAQRVRNVTPALGALTIGLMALDTWRSERAEKQRNAIRHDAVRTAREDVQSLVEAYLAGTEEQRGLGAALQEGLDAVATELAGVESDFAMLTTRLDEATICLDSLRAAVDHGRQLLDPQEETAHEC